MGPCKQCQRMFEDKRKIATIVLLLMMVSTLVVALVPGIPNNVRVPLILLCCIVQLLAWIWYSLSYIPFARDCVKNTCRGWCGSRWHNFNTLHRAQSIPCTILQIQFDC